MAKFKHGKHEKYVHGRKEGVKDNQGKKVEKGVIRTIDGMGPHSDSGSHDHELCQAAHGIYSKAVSNGGGHGEIGDKAVKTR